MQRLRRLVLRSRLRLGVWIIPRLGEAEQCLVIGSHHHVDGVCSRCGLQEPLVFR